MWKTYSASYLKHNRGSSVSILAAAFVAALFLSLLGTLFYNFWVYEVEQTVLEEGDWHCRIEGVTREDVTFLRSYANVESVTLRPDRSEGDELVVDLTFHNPRRVYTQLPELLEQMGLEMEAGSYHTLLLSRYLIYDPQDDSPPMLLTFYLAVLLLASLALVLVIHNAFAASMQARMHQFGILASIGATPGQIRIGLTQEAAVLCALPSVLGIGLGIAGSFGTIRAVNSFAANLAGRHGAVFRYHGAVLAVTVLAVAFTVFLSVWLPARKLSRQPPLEAIRSSGELSLKKKRSSPILRKLFGTEGMLAGNALKAQKKALRTSTLSLTLSFLAFTLILCFFTLSSISTDETYFARYQDCWDIQVTVQDTRLADFTPAGELSALPGVKSCAAYQKGEGIFLLSESDLSAELRGNEGLRRPASLETSEGVCQAKAVVVVLDDGSFADYAAQLGAGTAPKDGILLNRIWDSTASSYRHPVYIPYVRSNLAELTLDGGGTFPVALCTTRAPILREEYAHYTLALFVPLSMWMDAPPAGILEKDTNVRILSAGDRSLEDLNALQTQVDSRIGDTYAFESENRQQERIDNDQMIAGYEWFLGGLCGLLAVIGLANLFSNTLGFLRMRRREFAQYRSVGMTPGQMKKLFLVEALVIAGRPVVITLPLAAVAVGFMLNASYLDPAEFLARAPVVPILLFLLAICVFVALAYVIGGRRILHSDLSEPLRCDSIA